MKLQNPTLNFQVGNVSNLPIIYNDNSKEIIEQLVKENNYDELAYETVRLEISLGDNPYRGNDFPIEVAKRDRPSSLIRL